ncbi:MAG: Sec-independent protein translocase subunit TatA [Actinomycetes bacterium]
MGNFKGWEIVIILVLLLLLFGAKRLPDAARGLGRSLRIFKAETKNLRDDDEATDAPGEQQRSTAPRQIEGRPEQPGPATQRAPDAETQER